MLRNCYACGNTTPLNQRLCVNCMNRCHQLPEVFTVVQNGVVVWRFNKLQLAQHAFDRLCAESVPGDTIQLFNDSGTLLCSSLNREPRVAQ